MFILSDKYDKIADIKAKIIRKRFLIKEYKTIISHKTWNVSKKNIKLVPHSIENNIRMNGLLDELLFAIRKMKLCIISPF